MAASSGIYTSDDLLKPSIASPSGDVIRRAFTCTVSTALAQTGATKWLLGDVILLCPIPPRCRLWDYRVYVPNLDSGSAVTLDLGDSQVLAGAITGITKGSVAFPAVGSTFTLTATASTSSFTSTNGLLSVNGVLVNYESLSGSTFVNCRSYIGTGVIPDGAPINQCGNTAAYQSNIALGQNAVGYADHNTYWLTGGSVTLSTVLNATPVDFPATYQTAALKVGATGPTFGNVGPEFFLTLRIHTAVNTVVTTGVITGWITYSMLGV